MPPIAPLSYLSIYTFLCIYLIFIHLSGWWRCVIILYIFTIYLSLGDREVSLPCLPLSPDPIHWESLLHLTTEKDGCYFQGELYKNNVPTDYSRLRCCNWNNTRISVKSKMFGIDNSVIHNNFVFRKFRNWNRISVSSWNKKLMADLNFKKLSSVY